MKHKLLVAGLVLVGLFGVSIFHSPKVAAACNGYYNSMFCLPSDDALEQDAFIDFSGTTDDSSMYGYSNQKDRTITVDNNTNQVTVKFRYRTHAAAPGGKVLVWSTIDASNPFTDDLSPSGGAVTDCPHTGASPSQINGAEGSPYSKSGNTGVTKCDTAGKIVYWGVQPVTGAGEQNTYSYTVKIDHQKYGNVTFCNRVHVSVTGEPGSAAFSSVNGSAGEIARLSNVLCFKIADAPPSGVAAGFTASCSSRSYTITNSKEGGVIKSMAFQIRYGASMNVIVTGNTNGSGDKTGSYSFNSGTRYLLYLKDRTGQYKYAADSTPSCGGPSNPQPPTTACTSVYVKDDNTYNPPGGLNMAYNTTTYTTVTDSGGHTLINNQSLTRGASTTYRFQPLGNDITVKITRQFLNTSGRTHRPPTPDHVTTYSTVSTPHSCYHAQCTSMSMSGDYTNTPSGHNGVKTGGTITVSGTVVNTGEEALDNIGGNVFSMHSDNPAYNKAIDPRPLAPGGTANYSFTITAPSDGPKYYSVSQYPVFANLFRLGGDCPPATIDIYAKYIFHPENFQPTVSFEGSAENPDKVKYNTGMNLEVIGGSPAVYAIQNGSGDPKAKNDLDLIRAGGTTASGISLGDPSRITAGKDFNTGNTAIYDHKELNDPQNDSRIGRLYAGDRFCAYEVVDRHDGWIGPHDSKDQRDVNFVNTGRSTEEGSPDTCAKVVNEPYAHFYGADVSAGGSFDGTCSSSGSILTYSNATGRTPPLGGSAGQFGAFSNGQAKGFMSAFLRSNNPKQPVGLSFTSSPSNNAAPDMQSGGNFAGSHCIKDYWASKPSNTENFAGSPASGSHAYYVNSDLNTGGFTVPYGTRAVIYVEGNVNIGGPITYANPNGYSDVNNIPALTIIAHGRTINIGNSVTQLDGSYISQPDSSGNGGIIKTCSGIANLNDFLHNCNNRLIVNGAFVAKKVYLMRSYGTLRNSTATDRYNSKNNSAPKRCDVESSFSNTNYNNCAAEIFNFTPETYLAQPPTTLESGPTTDKYDYITSLAPVL